MKRWDEMTPRERDALVAEKVVGWHLTGEVMYGEHPIGFPPHQVTSMPLGVLHYTTNIGNAWEVVEKLNYAFDICSARDGIVCSFQWKSGEFPRHRYVSAKAKTAPEAICLAALRACGVDV